MSTASRLSFEGLQGSALASAFDELLGEQNAKRPDGPAPRLSGSVPDRVRRPHGAAAGGGQTSHLKIYGPLEARLTQSDRVIVGGLVEGVWPPAPRIDPWLSRPMRHELGLDLPERRIGLSAHDFAQLLGADDVILSHAAKVGGAPAVASRFLHRLEAVAGEERWNAAKAAGENYVRFAAELDRPDKVEPIPQPAPKPPRATRPLKLSVTAIEDWLRDPYTIYAKYILRLAPARSRRHAAVGRRSRLGDPRCARRIHANFRRRRCPTIPRGAARASARNISRR